MRDVVFIVGMGRSGTSALTRVLALCGASLPRRLLGANAGNPTGHWEPQDAIDVNFAFLESRGSSWYDPRLDLQLAGVTDDERRAFVWDIMPLLREGVDAGDAPIAIKEPRIAGLLPYWARAAVGCGLRVTVVHIVRHPDDVAASLFRRDRLEWSASHALWLKYNLIAERDGRPFPRLIVSYDDVLADWRTVVAACVRQLGLDLTVSAAAATAVDGFLRHDLRHHASPAQKPVADFTAGGWIQRTYSLLQAARYGRPPAGELDAILAEYAAASRNGSAIDELVPAGGRSGEAAREAGPS